MRTIGKSTFKIPALTLLLAAATQLSAQTAAPVPTAFATAHTVFLAPAGAPSDADPEDYVATMYASTYQMLGSLNKYQLVTSPSNADLSMEVSVVTLPAGINGNPSDVYLRLAVHDTKTRALLWTIDVPINNDFRPKSVQKGLDAAEAHLAAALNALASGTIPTSTPTTKSRMSQEKQ